MAIWGYIGGIGSGKTMNAAVEAIATATRRDAVLLSNIRLEAPGLESYRLHMTRDGIDTDTLLAVVVDAERRGKGCVILLDEVGVLMPARFWQDFPIDLMFVLSQSRKLRADLIYTAQDVEQVDAILRRLTSFVWLVKCLPAASIDRQERGKRPWLFLLSRWKVKSIEGQFKQPLGRRWKRYRRAWEALYSTDELVAPPEAFRQRKRRRSRDAEGTDRGTPALPGVVGLPIPEASSSPVGSRDHTPAGGGDNQNAPRQGSSDHPEGRSAA